MSRSKLGFVALFSLVLFLTQSDLCAAKKKAKKSDQTIQTEAGLKIPEWGLVIDAYYLPALDQMIPGYRVLNIVIENNRQDAISLDVLKDKWYIIDQAGRKQKAYNHIKQFDKRLWERMSELAKSKLDYPAVIPPGKMVAVDVFFKNDVELAGFHGIEWDSHAFGKNFNVLTEYEDELQVKYDTTKILDMPQPAPDVAAQPVESEKQEQDYIQARDQYLNDKDKQAHKVYYITPDGKVVETIEGENAPPDSTAVPDTSDTSDDSN